MTEFEYPRFRDLTFPGKRSGGDYIHRFEFVEIDKDVRVYYDRTATSDHTPEARSGFRFYVTEFVERVVTPEYDTYKTNYDDPTLAVECLFWGWAYWDGMRHLYMGDERTDNDGYLYYSRTETCVNVFKALANLESKYCSKEGK